MIDRRTFLGDGARGLGGAAALWLTSPALAACTSAKSRSTAPSTAAEGAATTTSSGDTVVPGTLGALTFVAPWPADVQTAGEYVADSKGFWTQQGFSSVTVVSTPPTASPRESMLSSGAGLVAIMSVESTAAAIQKGFNIVVIGAEYQKSPFCIMSPAKSPLKTPQDMVGKKIGVQPSNDAVWNTFLRANGIDASRIDTVSATFDPTPLTQGVVDGWFSFITYEPIELASKGFNTVTFLLADFNLPEAGNLFVCTTDALKSARDKLRAAMIGDILGWKEALSNPSEAATFAVHTGQNLSQTQELLQARAQATLMVTADSHSYGLFYLTPGAQAANIKTLGLSGTNLTASELFDMSLLDEIYQDPSLKAVPTPATG